MKYIDWLLGIINARSDTLGNVDGKVRYAKPSDLNSIYTLQGLYDELDYPKKGLEIILNNKEAINFVIENKSGEILNYVLGYPSSYYKDTQKDIGWIITAECPELNDNKSFYLELTETRPGYQRKGL
jgi:hypothetical protein